MRNIITLQPKKLYFTWSTRSNERRAEHTPKKKNPEKHNVTTRYDSTTEIFAIYILIQARKTETS